MWLFFKNPNWHRLNFTKWQILTLTNITSANPTLSTTKCFWKVCTELNSIQRSINSAYHNILHFCKNIIRTYRDHFFLATRLNHFLFGTLGFVTHLYTSIFNYEAEYKHSSMANYIQSATNIENDKMFFTNWH